jgi:hypothetical protein
LYGTVDERQLLNVRSEGSRRWKVQFPVSTPFRCHKHVFDVNSYCAAQVTPLWHKWRFWFACWLMLSGEFLMRLLV